MPDGQQAEQALQSVADTAVSSQTFSGSFNISGVIAVIVQVFFFRSFSPNWSSVLVALVNFLSLSLRA